MLLNLPDESTKIFLKFIFIYVKYILTESFINAEHSKYIEMYMVENMATIEQVREELREELRAEMRQLRDELLRQKEPPEEEAAREVQEITADLRALLSETKKYTEYTEFDSEKASELLKPLANAERLKILQALYSGGKYFTDMVELTGLEHSPLRFHLSSLIDAGYAEQERYRGRYLITVYGKIALRLVGFLFAKRGDIHAG